MDGRNLGSDPGTIKVDLHTSPGWSLFSPAVKHWKSMVVLFVFMSIWLKKMVNGWKCELLVQRMEFDKCITFHNVQIEEREKVANAVVGNLSVTGFGKNEIKYCSFRAMSPFSSSLKIITFCKLLMYQLYFCNIPAVYVSTHFQIVQTTNPVMFSKCTKASFPNDC